jgi:hypothetical protein
MADPGPPPSPLDIFHLDTALTYIAAVGYAGLGDRDILIANQNSQQQQLSDFGARLDSVDSAISSSSAQLSENIAALGSTLTTQIDTLAVAQTALGASLAAQIATFNNAANNLLTLLEALIQALQNVATVNTQNQILLLLGELAQATSPFRARTLALDTDSVVTTPQPIPAKQGP